jgi:large subunit ribosomal protein L21
VYAVVETGGKQYKVAVGDTIEVEKLAANTGDRIELERVLMVADEGGVRVGQPVLESAKVSATVLGLIKGPKQIIYKYRAKERYRRKTGHRQTYTRLRIDEIKV